MGNGELLVCLKGTARSGVLVMGLNGCGKSTLGRALAERIGYRFMDAEDYYFPAGQENPYAVSRTREEALALLRADVDRHPRFVYASVFGPRDEEIEAMCALAVVLSAPEKVRLSRIEARSAARFGARALPGGNLYEQEQSFRAKAAARSEADVDSHAARLPCPILKLDGMRPIIENLSIIESTLRR